MLKYFPFTSTGAYSGNYEASTSFGVILGTELFSNNSLTTPSAFWYSNFSNLITGLNGQYDLLGIHNGNFISGFITVNGTKTYRLTFDILDISASSFTIQKGDFFSTQQLLTTVSTPSIGTYSYDFSFGASGSNRVGIIATGTKLIITNISLRDITTTTLPTVPTGSICTPSDIVKIGLDWNTVETVDFLSGDLTVKSLVSSDWTTQLKEDWVKAYLKYIGLGTLSNTNFNLVLQKAEDIDLFNQLSNPSVAYVNKDIVSNEISIGLNVYDLRFVIALGNTLANNDPFKSLIYLNHTRNKALVSNVCKVIYKGYEEIVWCFDGIEYKDYEVSNTPSLIDGGGNIFGQVKLAGDGIITKYIAKRNIDPYDPTVGICSGDSGPFCMGDEIHLIDTSVWTTNEFGSNGSAWTWIGDYSQLKYQWHIADITNPCYDYRNYGVENMKFPIRVIQFCELDDFNYTVDYFYYPTDIETDIIVRINEHVFWYPGNSITISDFEIINSYYASDWVIVSKGTDVDATNNENDSTHFRLRKTGFDNTIFQFPTAIYKIYRSF